MFAFAALAMVQCPAQGSVSMAMRLNKITVCCAVQALLRPYLNSKFEIVDVGRSQKTGITFGSQLHTRSGSTFRRWLYLWLKMLVSNASGAARYTVSVCNVCSEIRAGPRPLQETIDSSCCADILPKSLFVVASSSVPPSTAAELVVEHSTYEPGNQRTARVLQGRG